MKRRNISKPTAIKTLDELDSKKGIGLIERVRLGLWSRILLRLWLHLTALIL